jgi:RHS repeat-associated protein
MTRSVTQVSDPLYGLQAPLVGTSVVTTPDGKKMTTTHARSVTINGTTRVSQVDTMNVNGKSSTSTYNVAAKTVTNQSPAGRQTVSTLDSQGRVVQVQAGNLALTAYAYDTRGRLSSVTVGTGTTARVTTFGYDDLDRLQTVTDPLLRTQSYAYDDANRVTTQTFTDGNRVVFSYDANGNVTSVTPPGRTAHGFGFDANDLMSSYAPPVLSTEVPTTYEYNLDKQPTVIHRPDGTTIVTTYDGAGREATVTYPAGPSSSDGSITVTRNYHPTTGNLSGMTASDGQSLAYAYDGNLPLSTTWSGTVAGSMSRTFDNNLRVVTESVNGANSVALGYDDDGLPTSVDGLAIARDPTNGLVSDTTLGSVTSHRTYDNFGKWATYEAKFGTTSLYSTAYVRDALGRIEQKTETVQGARTVWNYSYDTAGRLWQVMKDGVLTATYLYDANGNRLSKTTTSGAESGTYDAQDRLLTYGRWAYTYTANGDLLTKTDTSNGQVTNYAYDAQGNLRHVGLPDGRSIDYVIDAENRRIGKKVDGALVRRWLYRDKLNLVAELDGAGNVIAHYVGGLVIKGTNTYNVVADHLGTPRLLVDRATGTVAQRLDLDEFGQVTSDSNPGFQVLGFAGGIYDPDTGLMRFGARDYDPTVGRWTAKDPIRFDGGQTNLYVYAAGDPVNRLDRSGTNPVLDTVCAMKDELADWCGSERPTYSQHKHRNDNNSCPKHFPTNCSRSCSPGCNDPRTTSQSIFDNKTRFSDGSECIYNDQGDLTSEGSFNFGADPASKRHICVDVLPYCYWGD